MTTNCVINELRTLGEDFMGAALAAKRLEKRRCTHGGNPVNAAECIKDIIGNYYWMLNIKCQIIILKFNNNNYKFIIYISFILFYFYINK